MLSTSASTTYRRFGNRPFLVVDWMTTGVVLSEVSTNGGEFRILRSCYEPWPAGLEPFTAPEAAGQFLKSVCNAGHFPTSAVAVSVPRRDVSFKLLELPNVSNDELGPMLSLQIESRAQANSQPVAWDILPHQTPQAATNRYVTLITVSTTVILAIQKASATAGWNHLVITSGDLLIPCVNSEKSQEWTLYIQANRAKLELLLCHNGLPVAGQAMAMPTQSQDGHVLSSLNATALQSTAARLMASCPPEWKAADSSVSVIACGTFAEEIVKILGDAGINVSLLASDERSLRVLGVARSLLKQPAESKSKSACRIDFLRPRSADPRTAARKRRGIRLTLVASAIVGCGLLAVWSEYTSLQKQLADVETQRQQMQQYVDRGKDVVGQWEYVSRWQRESLAANQEIAALAEVLPSRERLILTRLQLENLVDAENGMLRVDGLCEDVEDVLTMNSAILEKSDHYDLRPQGIEPASADSDFPSRFRIEAELKRRSKTAITEESR
ncbi:MAG: hypothetical protein U0936_05655 [Planctomycetaceae bacterium]